MLILLSYPYISVGVGTLFLAFGKLDNGIWLALWSSYILHSQGLWSAILIGDDASLKAASFLVFVLPISMAVLSTWFLGAASPDHTRASGVEIHNKLPGNSSISEWVIVWVHTLEIVAYYVKVLIHRFTCVCTIPIRSRLISSLPNPVKDMTSRVLRDWQIIILVIIFIPL
jgi:hypothetical protein